MSFFLVYFFFFADNTNQNMDCTFIRPPQKITDFSAYSMIRNRSLSGINTLTLLLLALLLILVGSTDVLIAGSFTSSSPAHETEQQYKQAKDYYYQLRRDDNIQDSRDNWVKGARDFRRIYLDDPKGELAPNCLFMMATMHYRMYLRFQVQVDLDEAITYYRDVWLLFPDNTLADDSIYWTAEIYRKHKKNPDQAARLYARQIKRYPDGDKYSQALNRLREINDTHEIARSEQNALPAPGTNLVKVLPVQYWSSDDYTRVVIRSSAPVTYTSKLLDKKDHQPRKLLINFAHSTIDRQYTAPVSIKEGLLRQLQSEQLDSDSVRVSLDIESISTYKIFSLNDPFRVIVDVHGQQKVLSASKSVPQLKRERVEPRPGREPSHASTPLPRLTEKTEDLAKLPAPSDQNEPFTVLQENKKRKPGTGPPEKMSARMNSLSLAQQLGLGVQRIVIDPGHGGKDPGAMGNNLKEKDITLAVARKTADHLRSIHKYEVILTREDDRSLPLEERTAIANTRKADLFVSIHVNAHPNKSTSGVETFYLNLATNTEAMRVAARENATTTMNISDLQDILKDLMQNSKIHESSILAEYVQNRLIAGLRENRYSTRDLGVKQAPFYVLIGAEMPAVLAEISFISNPGDADRLRQDTYLDQIARQIAAGVAGYVDNRATAALQ
ncbi:MAG TPA: N-acetylmuramoyl-L-alanine amidase, partial [Desulfobacteraceae bacterium]|nr:N-acetylmuramoyl-L-alanine amidase [Desulfobacteraceae bacterium]